MHTNGLKQMVKELERLGGQGALRITARVPNRLNPHSRYTAIHCELTDYGKELLEKAAG